MTNCPSCGELLDVDADACRYCGEPLAGSGVAQEEAVRGEGIDPALLDQLGEWSQIMDANRNVLWKNPDRVPAARAERMDLVWGDRSWRQELYRGQAGLFGTVDEKLPNEAVAEAFRKRLQDVAGFKYVPSPIPMKNTLGATVYYLFFATHNETGADIVEDILKKYRR